MREVCYWKVSKIVTRGNAAYEVKRVRCVSKLRPRNAEKSQKKRRFQFAANWIHSRVPRIESSRVKG